MREIKDWHVLKATSSPPRHCRECSYPRHPHQVLMSLWRSNTRLQINAGDYSCNCDTHLRLLSSFKKGAGVWSRVISSRPGTQYRASRENRSELVSTIEGRWTANTVDVEVQEFFIRPSHAANLPKINDNEEQDIAIRQLHDVKLLAIPLLKYKTSSYSYCTSLNCSSYQSHSTNFFAWP